MKHVHKLRAALQLLRTHPEMLFPLRQALDAVGSIPGWREGGYSRWLYRNDCLTLKALNAPDDMRPELVSEHSRLGRRCKEHGVKPPRFIMTGERHHFHETINKRQRLLDHIKKCERNGLIGIVESGRDCDCVDYVHPRGTIPATLYHYDKLERETGQWADGPFNLTIVTPEEAAAQPYESHDHALEAFEDGHPHVVYSTFGG